MSVTAASRAQSRTFPGRPGARRRRPGFHPAWTLLLILGLLALAGGAGYGLAVRGRSGAPVVPTMPGTMTDTPAPAGGAPMDTPATAVATGKAGGSGSAMIPAPPPPPDPFLKAVQGKMRNQRGAGDEVPLRGVNLGSWLVMEPWMCPLDSGGLKDHWSALNLLEERFGAAEADRLFGIYQDTWIQDGDFDRIAALGMNVVRIPVWYRTFQHEDGTWRKDAFTRLDRAVAAAWKRGIYTLIDLHGPAAQQRAKAHCTGRITETARLWKEPGTQQGMLDLWVGIARHYAGNPAIAGYDLLNEPMDVPSRQVMADLLDRCYQAIRAVDPDHTLVMEATFHSWNLGMLPDPRTKGWDNVAYQYHVYAWKGWNDVAATKAAIQGTIADWRSHADWGVPGQVGEFNMGTREGWDHAVEAYSAAGLSWMSWAYKSSSRSTWGLYNPVGKACLVPNLHTDTAERIATCWATWGTGNFALNPMTGPAQAMPVAVDDAFQVVPGETLAVPRPGILGNDQRLALEKTGPALTARLEGKPAHGTLDLAADGGFRYVPTPGFRGVDTFTYRVGDGRTESVRLARCVLTVATR